MKFFTAHRASFIEKMGHLGWTNLSSLWSSDRLVPVGQNESTREDRRLFGRVSTRLRTHGVKFALIKCTIGINLHVMCSLSFRLGGAFIFGLLFRAAFVADRMGLP